MIDDRLLSIGSRSLGFSKEEGERKRERWWGFWQEEEEEKWWSERLLPCFIVTLSSRIPASFVMLVYTLAPFLIFRFSPW